MVVFPAQLDHFWQDINPNGWCLRMKDGDRIDTGTIVLDASTIAIDGQISDGKGNVLVDLKKLSKK